MQKKTILAKLIPVLLILGALWTLFFVGRTILQKADNNNLNFLPSDASWYVQVDLQKLIQDETGTILFNDSDKEIMLLLEELIENDEGKLKDVNQYGIQFNSSISAFGLDEEVFGLLLNLSSSRKFNAYFSSKGESKTVHKTSGDVGLLLFSRSKEVPVTELNKIADDFFNSSFLKVEKSDHLVSFKILKEISSCESINKGEFTLDLNENQLLVNGRFESLLKGVSMPTIAPSDFHIDWQQPPLSLTDSLRLWTDASLPIVKSLSINYSGSDLVTQPRMAITPIINGVVQLSDSLSITAFLEKNEMEQRIDSYSEESFIYAGATYFFKQIDVRTIYIGRDKFDKKKLNSKDVLLSISGSPEAITTVEGESLARKLLGILPLYKASDKLSHSAKNVDVKIKKNSDGSFTLTSSLTFKENKFVVNELLKFVLEVRN